ncbi:MAG: L,D-transpeptidase family protein [Clostridia bacterium]|nr:L,D-transpeptidase family protein [Clostridia bacterium]
MKTRKVVALLLALLTATSCVFMPALAEGTASVTTTTSFLAGDVNGDGKVDVEDVTTTRDVCFGLGKYNAETIARADVNKDGLVDINDILAIMNIIFDGRGISHIQPTPTPIPPLARGEWPGGLPSTPATMNKDVSRPKYKYRLQINLAKQRCVAYTYDAAGKYTVPVYAMVVSTGAVYGTTPLGTHHIMEQFRWKVLNGDYWGQYSSRIVGGVLFHSVPAFQKEANTVNYSFYNKLGSPASSGCVRVTTADAYWIYKNCIVGTVVEVIDDKTKPDYETYIVPKKLVGTSGWDPTDPDANNPLYVAWPTSFPKIWET